MNRKEHLTKEGLQQIINLRASINLGLSDELKVAFPNTTPVQRPEIKDQEIKDPQWLAGFASAEGCFLISVYNSKTITGLAAKLIFKVTQHSRDAELIENLAFYLKCGQYYI